MGLVPTVIITTSSTVCVLFSAGENKEPLHVYEVGYELLNGLIRSTTVEMSSVEEVYTVPGSGALLPAVHVAIGMPVKPVNSSDTTQVKLNSEPATKLPEVLTLIAIDGDGTAELQECSYYLSNKTV